MSRYDIAKLFGPSAAKAYLEKKERETEFEPAKLIGKKGDDVMPQYEDFRNEKKSSFVYTKGNSTAQSHVYRHRGVNYRLFNIDGIVSDKSPWPSGQGLPIDYGWHSEEAAKLDMKNFLMGRKHLRIMAQEKWNNRGNVQPNQKVSNYGRDTNRSIANNARAFLQESKKSRVSKQQAAAITYMMTGIPTETLGYAKANKERGVLMNNAEIRKNRAKKSLKKWLIVLKQCKTRICIRADHQLN